ncbi:hypothetical protein C1645_780645 [Glomus cerebriforme]|uniref:Uncharacterized protein n=1 Tax=Glomus cerebriforme TaxID=658196 RepID=A0A397SPZ1_9GLOM|nr:hypothetical protein C1645_780645 [Glomus cerebriforme]
MKFTLCLVVLHKIKDRLIFCREEIVITIFFLCLYVNSYFIGSHYLSQHDNKLFVRHRVIKDDRKLIIYAYVLRELFESILPI